MQHFENRKNYNQEEKKITNFTIDLAVLTFGVHIPSDFSGLLS